MPVGIGEKRRISLEMDADKYEEIKTVAGMLYPYDDKAVVKLLWHCYEFCLDIFHRDEFLNDEQ